MTIYKLILPFLFVHLCSAGERVRQEYLHLPEGAKCAWKGVEGVCAAISNCLSAMEDLRNNQYPPICNFEGEKAIICCTDCELDKSGKSHFINPGVASWMYKTGNKARDSCLDHLSTLNYSCDGYEIHVYKKEKHPKKNCYVTKEATIAATGEKDKYSQFRHLAVLGSGEDIETAHWECVGSIISDRFILTSASCFGNPHFENVVKFVAVGILKLSDPPELWQRYDVKRTIPSPKYRPPVQYHDIGLVETTTAITFNERVLPACLHTEETEADKFADVIYWRELNYLSKEKTPVEAVQVKALDEHICSLAYPLRRHLTHGYIHIVQICYGHENNEDKGKKEVDTGENGAPIQNQQHVSKCVTTILGVSQSLPARVSYFVPWIESIVWP